MIPERKNYPAAIDIEFNLMLNTLNQFLNSYPTNDLKMHQAHFIADQIIKAMQALTKARDMIEQAKEDNR